MSRLSLTAVFLLLPLASSAVVAGDSANPWVRPAELLQAATVTVRVARDEAAEAEDIEAKSQAAGQNVIICTGVSVGPGQVITSVVAGSDSRLRLTLPGGRQAEARVRILDEYSGLTLLETEDRSLPALELAPDKPAVGSGVLLASAWGVEQPVVAVGVVAANERLLRGATFPPLMQCDVRLTDTSAGAGLVNSEGKLLGIVVATDTPEARRDGGYAVPATHVQRLLRIADKATDRSDEPSQQSPSKTSAGESSDPQSPAKQETKAGGVIILKRQRPIVGMRLEGDEESVFVRQIVAGGPADRAGIKVGDQVLATEGVAIRSVYQAVLPALHKQPGDSMRFRIQREGELQTVDVVLGGGLELSSAPRNQLSDLVQPQLQVGRDRSGAYVTRGRKSHVAEVFAPSSPQAVDDKAEPTAAEKLALLEKALDRYRQVIELQQQQIQSLKAELKAQQAKSAP